MGLEPLPCEEMLQDWGWFSWEEGWLQGHPTTAQGMEEMQPGSSQWCVAGRWVRDSWHMLKQRKFKLTIRKKGFPHKDSPGVEPRPRQVVPSPALEVIKPQLDTALSSLV